MKLIIAGIAASSFLLACSKETSPPKVVEKPIQTIADLREPRYTPTFKKCMEDVDPSAFKITQWLACADNELKAQEKMLDDEFRQLIKLSEKSGVQDLQKSAKSWRVYRSDWCRFDAANSGAPSPEVNEKFCQIDLTIDQLIQYEKNRKQLESDKFQPNKVS